ncbi:alpha/beta hydrolase family protein [Pseudoduganella sp. UC29_106]|uniref:alpha/beta hydrolase family protein n=1 Tax=Pseudoduganella sp. UC29_106 TaxID=3374553 RepID=UPI003757911F
MVRSRHEADAGGRGQAAAPHREPDRSAYAPGNQQRPGAGLFGYPAARLLPVQHGEEDAEPRRRQLPEHQAYANGHAGGSALQGTRRPGDSGDADHPRAGRAQEPADGGAGPRRPLCARQPVGLGSGSAVPRFARLRGAAAGILRQHRLWRSPLPRRLEAVGPEDEDDAADGVKWAIEKGYADPKRVCIAGASYGGYQR